MDEGKLFFTLTSLFFSLSTRFKKHKDSSAPGRGMGGYVGRTLLQALRHTPSVPPSYQVSIQRVSANNQLLFDRFSTSTFSPVSTLNVCPFRFFFRSVRLQGLRTKCAVRMGNGSGIRRRTGAGPTTQPASTWTTSR